MEVSGLGSTLAVLAVLAAPASLAQMRPASEAEIERMRDALLLDQTPEWSHLRVLEIQAAFTNAAGGRPERLDGWVYFEPYRVQFELCTMMATFLTGLGSETGYDWSFERFAYWNWPGTDDASCRIADRSSIPGRAVQSAEPIPSAAMAFVLANAGALLESAYDYVQVTGSDADPVRERLLGYRQNDGYRLERLEITPRSSPEFGFAYVARYRAPGIFEGPAIVFSITQPGFVVHSVALWTE